MRKRRRIGFELKHPVGRIDACGYVVVACCFVKDSKWIAGYKYQHRLVMESVLGRSLRSDEVVHHRDRDRQNNNPENLDVMLRSDHNLITAKAMRAGLAAKRSGDKVAA